ncbi:hypothetical protein Tco_1241753 [Tanacetum coccineum]
MINGERDQRKRLIQFLMGLDECYSNIRGQILLMQPLPTTAKAYTMVRQEEKQREGIAPKSTSSTILNSSTNRYNSQNNHSYPKHNVSNTPNSRFTPQRTAQTGSERRSNFMKRDQASQDKPSTSKQTAGPSEDHVSARMNQLQNQIINPPMLKARMDHMVFSHL